MDQLYALSVTVPLVAAAALLATRPLFAGHRRAADLVAVAVSASVAVMLGFLVVRTYGADSTYWFAGFRPSGGIVIGIDFEAGPLSAGLACLGAVLMTASMVFSWRYFPQAGGYFHVLMLTFLAGMTGFCLTGDVFDLFVWFELMGVSAYALTAYRPEERGPIQGALNFAITNSVGAYLSLTGIALIYGRTGALNMAQIAAYVDRHTAVGNNAHPHSHRLSPDHHRAARHGRDRAVPLLAPRRARGRADAGVRAVLRRDGRTRPVRNRPDVLVGVRHGARQPAADLAPVP